MILFIVTLENAVAIDLFWTAWYEVTYKLILHKFGFTILLIFFAKFDFIDIDC